MERISTLSRTRACREAPHDVCTGHEMHKCDTRVHARSKVDRRTRCDIPAACNQTKNTSVTQERATLMLVRAVRSNLAYLPRAPSCAKPPPPSRSLGGPPPPSRSLGGFVRHARPPPRQQPVLVKADLPPPSRPLGWIFRSSSLGRHAHPPSWDTPLAHAKGATHCRSSLLSGFGKREL